MMASSDDSTIAEEKARRASVDDVSAKSGTLSIHRSRSAEKFVAYIPLPHLDVLTKVKMAKQKFCPTRIGGFSGAKACIGYVKVLKNRPSAVGRIFCDVINLNPWISDSDPCNKKFHALRGFYFDVFFIIMAKTHDNLSFILDPGNGRRVWSWQPTKVFIFPPYRSASGTGS